MEKHYIVYKTTNIITNQYYLGIHGQVEDDNYLGSGLHLRRQIVKYGRDIFLRETLFIYNSESEAFAKEVDLLITHLAEPLCLNISKGGDGGANFKGRIHSDETKAKLSLASSDRKLSLEQRAKISEANKRRTPEFWEKAGLAISKQKIEFYKTERGFEVKKILSEKHQPHAFTNEGKKRMSLAAKKRFEDPAERAKVGRLWTDEERESWGKVQKEKWTPELRAKLSQSLKGNIPWNKKLDCGHIYRDKCACNKETSND